MIVVYNSDRLNVEKHFVARRQNGFVSKFFNINVDLK